MREAEQESESGDDETPSVHQYKQSLKNLEDLDPEFFAYLKENDADLLKFEDSEDDDDEISETDEDEDALHQPPDQLEVSSIRRNFYPLIEFFVKLDF